MLFSCFRDPAGFIAKAFSFLKSGGYLELMDVVLPLQCVDDSAEGTALGKWCPTMVAGAKVLGKDWTCTAKYLKFMEDAGFVTLQLVVFQWPTNPWAISPEQKCPGQVATAESPRWRQCDVNGDFKQRVLNVARRGKGIS